MADDHHGIAIAALPDMIGQRLDEARIVLQCECGWRQSFPGVFIFIALERAADEHRRATFGHGSCALARLARLARRLRAARRAQRRQLARDVECWYCFGDCGRCSR